MEKADAAIDLRLRTSDNLHRETRLEVARSGIFEALAMYGAELRGDSFGRGVDAAMSPEVTEALEFLTHAFRIGRSGENEGAHARFVLSMLEPSRTTSGPEPRLIREEGELQSGLTVSDPELIELLDRFSSVDRNDPTAQ